MSGGWNTIESDAGVFTHLLQELGVKNVQFEELLSLEPEALAELHPVYGVIFLFKYPTDTPYVAAGAIKPLDGEFDHDAASDGSLFFAAQTIQNACGTQALLSVLLNKARSPGAPEDDESTVDIGPALADFRDFTMPLPAEFRGEALSNSDLIRGAHNSFARSSPFADETQRSPDDEHDDAFHFVAYTTANGKLWELDGLQPAPISHGECDDDADAFAFKVVEVLQRRIARYDASEIRFNLVAMTRDLRLRAVELGDEEMLARERRKRRAWTMENALRRHNFVGFAGEVLRATVEAKLQEDDDGAAYRKWVETAKGKMVKRIEDRQERRKAAGGGDVEMAG